MNRLLYGCLVTLTTALMGSSFAIGKIGLAFSSPLLLVALRFTIAGLIMACLVKGLGRPHPKGVKLWAQMATIGFFQTAGVMGCIFVSLRSITAGESSILTFLNPLIVVILGSLFLKTRYKWRQWVGVCLGFIGVFLTLGAHLDLKAGTFLGLFSALSWAIATLLVKQWGQQIDTWVLTAYQMLSGGVILLVGSFLLEKPHFEPTVESLIILFWLAIMASIVQFAGWFYLLQKGDAGKTSAFLFLAPFFGVLSGYVLLRENLHFLVIVGGILIFIGIFCVSWTNNGKTAKHTSQEVNLIKAEKD
ncbi:MAG TPA: DMT family transporter [Candidatus Angelobacter sp.]|nr:DMT family transporter [Candidatus Angelobacter sp.]